MTVVRFAPAATGHLYLSSARIAGGTRQLMQVVDKLVQQARSERPQ
mgnify:CR=1 FL=1